MRCFIAIACICLLGSSVVAADESPSARLSSAANFDDDPAPTLAGFVKESKGSARQSDCGGGACVCGPQSCFWVRGEYLMWWTDGMYTPPLVTTSPDGTLQPAAGVLGQNTTTLVGGDLLTGMRSGGRIRFGKWLGAGQCWGVEGEYFGLGAITDHFAGASTGSPILARPFFNALTNQEDSELIAFPGVVSGTGTVDARGTLQSAGVRLLRNLCGADNLSAACDPDRADARLDLLLGYRFLRLDESLHMREQLTSQITADPGTFDIRDSFVTRNEFHGGEIGLARTENFRRWSVDLLFKLGFGNVRESVQINGSTVSDDGTGPQEFSGGLLAQRTNIGNYSRDRFALIPEVGATLGFQLSQRLQANVGYTLIYWDRVVRPGDQIDRTVNPNLFPPEAVPFTGPRRPEFDFQETSFWAQGLSFGLTYVW